MQVIIEHKASPTECVAQEGLALHRHAAEADEAKWRMVLPCVFDEAANVPKRLLKYLRDISPKLSLPECQTFPLKKINSVWMM